jgi:methionyl-tRNA formyltransferase
MKLRNVVFLGGYTSRSQAYVQSLLRTELIPSNVILYGSSKTVCGEPKKSVDKLDDFRRMMLPDLSVPIEQTVAEMCTTVSRIEGTDIESNELEIILESIKPELIIFSGYGGQIVSPRLCDKFSFLHMHSGKLPEYRGSTTLYYSILLNKVCGVTALLLDPGIDTGLVVNYQSYPIPIPNIDIDREYDSAIRADLLAKTLSEYVNNDLQLRALKQSKTSKGHYYVIHPVLKNIAIEFIQTQQALV